MSNLSTPMPLLVMDEDRAETGLHLSSGLELESTAQSSQRIPKRRFVGRKAATAREGNPNAAIEDSGAIQGALSKPISLLLI